MWEDVDVYTLTAREQHLSSHHDLSLLSLNESELIKHQIIHPLNTIETRGHCYAGRAWRILCYFHIWHY